ncbi:hypothetical protein [Mucilaginibacter agri]|uniref:Uncharacterized protein n=1 Tax=Mucilaginibacter agri TaxID=2695265 RepID=A0A965ZJP0_9SPHI|nr:hypothetical protein [Mucilaginibacter agri]NCD71323.1 hypothetical protein [Mucilaginibacter agri]
MIDLQYPSKISISLYLLLLLFSSCQRKSGNELNICIYGKYEINSTVSLMLDHKMIYENKITAGSFQELRLNPLYIINKVTVIDFSINGKDTSFNCILDKKNYLNLAYSPFHNQFQVQKVDSITFRKSGDDMIKYSGFGTRLLRMSNLNIGYFLIRYLDSYPY